MAAAAKPVEQKVERKDVSVEDVIGYEVDEAALAQPEHFRRLVGLTRLLEGSGICASLVVLPVVDRNGVSISRFCISLNTITSASNPTVDHSIKYIDDIMQYFCDYVKAAARDKTAFDTYVNTDGFIANRQKVLRVIFLQMRQAIEKRTLHVEDGFFEVAVGKTIAKSNPCLVREDSLATVKEEAISALVACRMTVDKVGVYARLARLYTDFIKLEEIIENTIFRTPGKETLLSEQLKAFLNYDRNYILRNERVPVHAELQAIPFIIRSVKSGLIKKGSAIYLPTSKLGCGQCHDLIESTQEILNVHGYQITFVVSGWHDKYSDRAYEFWKYPSAIYRSKRGDIEHEILEKCKSKIRARVNSHLLEHAIMEGPSSHPATPRLELNMEMLKANISKELALFKNAKFMNAKTRELELSLALCRSSAFKRLLEELSEGDVSSIKVTSRDDPLYAIVSEIQSSVGSSASESSTKWNKDEVLIFFQNGRFIEPQFAIRLIAYFQRTSLTVSSGFALPISYVASAGVAPPAMLPSYTVVATRKSSSQLEEGWSDDDRWDNTGCESGDDNRCSYDI